MQRWKIEGYTYSDLGVMAVPSFLSELLVRGNLLPSCSLGLEVLRRASRVEEANDRQVARHVLEDGITCGDSKIEGVGDLPSRCMMLLRSVHSRGGGW